MWKTGPVSAGGFNDNDGTPKGKKQAKIIVAVIISILTACKTEKQESEKENPKEKDVLFKHNNLSLVKSLTNSIRLKVEQLKLNLKKEIKLLKKNSKLLNNIKKTVKSNKKKEDNKKVVFLNNPNWNIVTTMITGISNSIS